MTLESQREQLEEPEEASGHLGLPHVEEIDAMDMQFNGHHTDPVFWPWLHETLYLPSTYDDLMLDAMPPAGMLDGSMPYNPEDGPFPMAFSNGEIRSPNGRDLHTAVSLPGIPRRTPGWDASGEASNFTSHVVEGSRMTLHAISTTPRPSESNYQGHAGRIRIINELVDFASRYKEPRSGAIPNHSAFWGSMSEKVREAFEIQESSSSTVPILDQFVHLFLEYFDPLWPLFSPQNLDTHQLHPLLYLVLTTIGAMYSDQKSSNYGNMMHGSVRACLVSPLELDNPESDLMWLAQARVSTQMAALYFGQPKAFSYAQHLGALLAAQVRRMDLFSDAYTKCNMAEFHNPRASDQDRLAIWLRLEARRRLAFAIFRAESYTSILLHARPMVYLGEIDLAFPSCETVWRSEKLPPRLCLQLIESDKTPGRDLRASDIYRIALEKDEALPPLDPIGHDLLALGLLWPVWEFTRDQDLFLGQTDDEPRASTAPPTDGGSTHTPSGIPSPGLSGLEEGTSRSQQHRILLTTRMLATPTLSEVERLESAPRQMSDFSAGYGRLLCAWQKWESCVPWVKSLVRTDFDRSGLMSSLLFYHLAFVYLSCPISCLHQIQYGLADNRPLDSGQLQLAYRWANSSRARLAAERAISICSLIGKQNPPRKRTDVKFNLLAYIALHRAIVLLWAFAGANDSVNSGESTGAQFTLQIGASPEIPINRSNSANMISYLVRLYDTISPGRWTPFAEAARPLANTPFPQLR
jgi:hypothetical protein